MRLFWFCIVVMAGATVILIASNDSGNVFGIESNAFAQTVYLGLWAAVLVIGFLGSRMRLSDFFRDLAYWMLILLLLMTGYQYRYELQDMASRLTAGLVPGSPMSISSAEHQQVMLEKSANGHFEVRMLVNGTSVLALVDTGASTTVLTAADAARVGIPTESLAFNRPVMTANGRALAAGARLDSIRIGSIEREDVPILIAEPDRLEQSLLGMQFLSSLSGFDVRGDRLILRD